MPPRSCHPPSANRSYKSQTGCVGNDRKDYRSVKTTASKRAANFESGPTMWSGTSTVYESGSPCFVPPSKWGASAEQCGCRVLFVK